MQFYLGEDKLINVTGCDVNGHHSQWGCPDNNVRGELFFQYIMGSNFVVCNRGNEPTFFNKNSETIVDVTLVSSSFCDFITDWRVSKRADYQSFSSKEEVKRNPLGGIRKLVVA